MNLIVVQGLFFACGRVEEELTALETLHALLFPLFCRSLGMVDLNH